jgi:hypothetical protein
MSSNAGMPLVLLDNATAWETFKQDLSLRYNLGSREIVWDDEQAAPDSYPCLVSAVGVESSLVFLFVYEGDAHNLLDAISQAPKKSSVSPLPSVSSEGAWNRHMVALMLTVVNELVEVGITDQERFESILEGMVSIVDEKHQKDIESVRQLVVEQFRKAKGDD